MGRRRSVGLAYPAGPFIRKGRAAAGEGPGKAGAPSFAGA